MPEGDPPLSLRDLDAIGVDRLNQVGPKRVSALAEMEIHSVLDLLQHYPRRYLDRTRQARIAELLAEEAATVVGTVLRASTRRIRGNRSLTDVVITDETGRLKLSFFNQAWRERQLSPDKTVVVHGRPTRYRGALQMTNPVVDPVGDRTGRIIAVYPQSDKAGVRTWDIAGSVTEALNRCEARRMADPVPLALQREFGLVERHAAMNGIHRPASMEESVQARQRLVFDELLRVQLQLVRRKRRIEQHTAGLRHAIDGELVERFWRNLPFPLTDSQRRVIDEIASDLAKPHPMHRLLQ